MNPFSAKDISFLKQTIATNHGNVGVLSFFERGYVVYLYIYSRSGSFNHQHFAKHNSNDVMLNSNKCTLMLM
jgi:hypothetical protein